MSKIYRVGIIGFGHMHINDIGPNFLKNPNTKVVAIADTKARVPELRDAPYTRTWNLQRAAALYPDVKVYEEYGAMLEREALDLAIITCEVAYHKEVVIACAKAGVDVSIEKPMALDLSEALAMVREVRERGTVLMVNWPVAWSASSHQMQELAAQGAIGSVIQVRMRIGHSGPLGAGAQHAGVTETAEPMTGYERGQSWWHQTAMGGGAMMDYCCYGCLLSRWYIGQEATAVLGMRANLNSPWGDADDSAAMIVRFPSAMATLEGTWATFHPGLPDGPVLYGTQGTMLAAQGGIKIFAPDGSQREIAAKPLSKGRENIAQEYVHHKMTGEALYSVLQCEENLRAMAILDAGIRSADSGRLENVDSVHWCIG